MKYFLILIFFAGTLNSFGQDTSYYDSDGNQVATLEHSKYFEVLVRNPSDTSKAGEKSYYVSGQLRSETNYSDYAGKKQNGKYKRWYDSGQLKTVIDFKDGKMHGHVLTYWENGQLKRRDNYENGKFIDGSCMTSAGEDTLHFDYEIMPEYRGGIEALWKFLSREIRYPKESKEQGITGRVIISFVVNADGSISDVKIVRGVADDLDQESLRVVKSMRPWKPGMEDGKPVRVQYNLPISFDLR